MLRQKRIDRLCKNVVLVNFYSNRNWTDGFRNLDLDLDLD